MVVAAMSLTMVSKTLWIAAGGGEYPAVLAATAVVIGFTGPGRYSLDAIVGLHNLLTVSSTTIGAVVVLVALIGAVPPVLATRKTLASRP
jgi:putative oxidoreductase